MMKNKIEHKKALPSHRCPNCNEPNEAIPIDDYDIPFDFYCSYCGHHYNKGDIG